MLDTATTDLRDRLTDITARIDWLAYVPHLLFHVERVLAGRAKRHVEANPHIREAVEAVRAVYGPEPLLGDLRILAASFVEFIEPRDIRDGDVIEDGGPVGGYHPGHVIAAGRGVLGDDGLYHVPMHMTGCGRTYPPYLKVRVLQRDHPLAH